MAVVPIKAKAASNGATEPTRLKEVLDVAAQLFNERGYRTTSLAHIGEVLGMNKASLYYYVRSKEDIARQLILRAARRLRNVSSDPVLDEMPADRALESLIREQCNVILDHPNEMGLLIQQRRFVEPRALGEITERERLYVAHVRSVIARGIDQGVFRAVDPGVATQLMLDAVNGLLRWYRPGGRLDRDAIIAEVCRFVLGGLGAPRPRRAQR